MCVCVNGSSEVVIAEPLADKQRLSPSVYTCQRVCEAEAAVVRWFTCAIPACVCPPLLVCLNTCTVRLEWWSLSGGHPSSSPPVVPPLFCPHPWGLVSSAGKQQVKVRRGWGWKKARSSCQRKVFAQCEGWHTSDRYKQSRRCKWKVTLWGFEPFSILIAGRLEYQCRRVPRRRKDAVFGASGTVLISSLHSPFECVRPLNLSNVYLLMQF